MIARLRASDSLRHGALVFGGVLFASLFNYLYYVLIGRRVGVEAYGVVTSLASAMLVVGAPAIVAQLISARLAADLEARDDRPALRRLGDIATVASAGVTVVVALIGFALRSSLSTYFNLAQPSAIVIVLVALCLFATATVQRGVLQGSHRFADYAGSMAIEAFVKVIAGVALAERYGADGALAGLALGSGSAVLFNLVAYRARFGTKTSRVSLDRKLIGRVFSHVGMGQLTLTVLMFYDVPLIKHVFDARSAGLYAAAALVGRAVLSAVSFVPTLVMPKATARAGAGLSPLPLLISALALSLGIVGVAAVLGALAPVFVVTTIGGRAFGDAAPLVFMYIVASGCLALATVIAAYKIGLHRYDFVIPSFVVAVAEIMVVFTWHPTLYAVVSVLAIGHAGVLVSMLYRITAVGLRAGDRTNAGVKELDVYAGD